MGKVYANVTGKVERIIYYAPQTKWGTFKITNTLVDDDIFKEETITAVGNFEGVFQGCIVEINGEHVKNAKFGDQISINFIKIKVEVSNKESIINWLSKSSIKGINIQNALRLFKKFKEETMNIVLDETDRILEVPGIGKKTLEKVKSSVIKYKSMSALIEYGVPLGFSYALINKLDSSLGSRAVKVLKDNIYSVLEYTDAISFKQIDTIAINNGINPEDPNRVKYGFLCTLKNKLMFEGSTGYGLQNIKDDISKELGINDINLFFGALNTLEQDNKLYLDGGNVYFKYFYDLEKTIARKIINLIDNNKEVYIDDNIVEEEINNFPFKLNSQQIDTVHNSLKNNISIVTGAGGCVDKKTEYLTTTGWKKISDYVEGDNIANYKPEGIYFEKPKEYHKYKATTWFEIDNKGSLNQKLSGEHRVPYISWKKHRFTVKSMEDIYLISKKHTRFKGKFLTSFSTNSIKKFDCTESYLRLLVASFISGELSRETVKVKGRRMRGVSLRTIKETEQIRIEQLLKECNLTYRGEHLPNNVNDMTYNYIIRENFNRFPTGWYNLNQKQLKVVFDEICIWGKNSRKDKVITSVSKEVADFIQFVVTTCGYRASIRKEYGGYSVIKAMTTLIGLEDNRGGMGVITSITTSEPKEDEYKYCFTTTSGYWVARREDKIFVTGNSGKTSILKALANIFVRGEYNVQLLSPTGKASRRIEECTGRVAQTIHKFLGVQTSLENTVVQTVPERTVLIVDESSMLDLVLFNKLLECFNHDTRIILIGDVHQLPSVGAGSVLEDLILSNRVDVNVLTDIMRQSKNSHIIKYCSKINEGTPIRQCNYDDFSYKTFEDKDILLEEFFVLYDKEVMEKGMENVQVIMPYKKGDLGVNKINNFVRDRYNDNKLDERYGYKVDDKVMQIRNNYDKEVFNGEVGVVSEINNDEDYLEVTYDKNMKVIYEIDEIDEIMLAYSCTVHKVQGSEYPTVFVLLSEENNMLHTRRVLYTACSRPRTSLYLLSMEDIVDKCIKNDYNRKRTTKLCSFLNQPNTEG